MPNPGMASNRVCVTGVCPQAASKSTLSANHSDRVRKTAVALLTDAPKEKAPRSTLGASDQALRTTTAIAFQSFQSFQSVQPFQSSKGQYP